MSSIASCNTYEINTSVALQEADKLEFDVYEMSFAGRGSKGAFLELFGLFLFQFRSDRKGGIRFSEKEKRIFLMAHSEPISA